MLRWMFERFNEDARQVVVTAQEEARQLDHGYIGTEHMLLGLLESADESPAQALGAFGVDAERVRSEIVKRIGRGKEPPGRQIPFTNRAKQVLELGLREALGLRHTMIGPGHVFLGLLRVEDGTAVRILVDLGATPVALRTQILDRLEGPGSEGIRVVHAEAVVTVKPDADLRRLLKEAGARALRGQRDTFGVADLLAAIRDNPELTREPPDAASSQDEDPH